MRNKEVIHNSENQYYKYTFNVMSNVKNGDVLILANKTL